MRTRALIILLVCTSLLMVAGCARTPKELIVGKWEITDPEHEGSVVRREFRSDGFMIGGFGSGANVPDPSPYRVIGDRLYIDGTGGGDYAGVMTWTGADRFVYSYSSDNVPTGTLYFERVH